MFIIDLFIGISTLEKHFYNIGKLSIPTIFRKKTMLIQKNNAVNHFISIFSEKKFRIEIYKVK